MAMTEIFRAETGMILEADTDAGMARISNGGRSKEFCLPSGGSRTDLPADVAKALRQRGADTSLFFWGNYPITIAARPAFDAACAEFAAKRRAAYLAREATLGLAVPGLSKLRAACEEEARYNREFNRMMEDESNDGVFPPAKPASDSRALAAEFPRAALYLKAESYSCAANDRKATAGSKAMAILADGGSETDARAVLDNWLPASAFTD